MPSIPNYRGIIPAIACPFTADRRIDEPALRRLASWLAGHDGVVAVMTNGHTGEVFSLTPAERAQVTRIVADELRGRLPVISSIVCEGIAEAAEHARAARAAGAAALDVMPPHHWLRFGFTPGHALEYFQAIHEAAPGLDLVCHVYPAWTRASYSSSLLADLARLPYVQAFKVGQRDMNKYARDIQALRDADASKAILTCHDEYLLASMVQDVDGALVGFATFIPQLIIDLWEAVKAGDLKHAQAVQALITPLKDAVYGAGEPTGEAHARMKAGMYLAGVLESAAVRPPTEAPGAAEMDALRAALAKAELLAR
ncbi:dihydrodipicolinate synthase family protein [Achromobacter xylosoxidans]|uniref:dihydrodipicolinate synthase family protein n=2 Tax=Alcaligenes xylosoxydans xylosoxydans TaxID=85698 RepID=UPI00064DC980|nr:dihydrodipicolinate synthase family protein [Achromobacter xylosoxidans]KAA5925577.1 dihydrodipicolinate synthase family protein [Achromobacter xylosoxidans]KMJ91787.1 dihydrodipicolinate synthetase [Achromobacter xylosoxidans]MBK1980708.1 dihydrodipicolinate synthase family protein [Achromobacter xylosoxidans]MCZ8384054.1 dihydrodipicolinate synthase family protein [Achromobacter xylosoxidans]QKI68383.1 dihydrodipicolinate synthase family protein [Achromobacter xylosoxidans]